MKVIALKTFELNNVKPKELNYVPKAGEEFEVTRERFIVLAGSNPTRTVYVKAAPEELKIETASVDKKEVVKKSSINVKKRPLQK